MTITERVARRYRVAAMSPEKMDALLQKIRKGATASLNWSQLGEVFQVLTPGWFLEKTTGFVQLHGEDGHADTYWTNKGSAESKYKEYEDAKVSSLPAVAKAGKLYVTELGDLIPSRHGDDKEFSYKAYLGSSAWQVITPAGKKFLAIPNKFDVGDGSMSPRAYKTINHGKVHLYDVIPWLKKETSFLEDVNAKLGMEAHEKVIRTRDGTGTCPVCFQNVKITNGRDIVLHGYKRPGTGVTHGNCDGYKYPAFELSSKGCEDHLKKTLEPEFKNLDLNLKYLKTGKVLSLTKYNQEYTPESPRWEEIMKGAILQTEYALSFTTGMIEAFKQLISKWKVRPLPKEGERKIDWFEEGRK